MKGYIIFLEDIVLNYFCFVYIQTGNRPGFRSYYSVCYGATSIQSNHVDMC